jgi:2-C-methyl-D-erythritol 2,4-cyclodiphosphate synthase
MLKIGQGFDLHQLSADRKLILAGVEIPDALGAIGHSDADVLLHAIIDALIGATALGDIGKFFPDNDNKYKDANSRELLKATYNIIKKETGYTINNIDSTIILEKPKLRNYIDLMRQNIANDLNLELNQVSIKAKTSEAIGIVGRQEAIVAQAIVLLIK